MPLLNEMQALPTLVAALLRINASELIIVDGGSEDGSRQWLEQNQRAGFLFVNSAPGRALQMNAGAARASSSTLLFLHADTVLPNGALNELHKKSWGRFDIEFTDNHSPRFRLLDIVARMINLRSRLSGVATGDQALFVNRSLFEQVGGFPNIPIMEDIALSKLLKQRAKPHCSRLKVRTSARRWRQNGLYKTILLMWALRLAYFFGVPAEILKKFYSQVR